MSYKKILFFFFSIRSLYNLSTISLESQKDDDNGPRWEPIEIRYSIIVKNIVKVNFLYNITHFKTVELLLNCDSYCGRALWQFDL